MALEIGTRLAHYDVTALIGVTNAGGHVVMGDARSDFQRHSQCRVIDGDQPRVYGEQCEKWPEARDHRL